MSSTTSTYQQRPELTTLSSAGPAKEITFESKLEVEGLSMPPDLGVDQSIIDSLSCNSGCYIPSMNWEHWDDNMMFSESTLTGTLVL